MEQGGDDDGSDRDSGAVDPRTPTTDLWITDNMGMRHGWHGDSVADLLKLGNYPAEATPLADFPQALPVLFQSVGESIDLHPPVLWLSVRHLW